MSTSVTKIVNLSQAALEFLVADEVDNEFEPECKSTVGGLSSDGAYAWLARGPCLEIVNTKTGSKIGAWRFGWSLGDAYTEVVCIEEIQQARGRLPLFVVGVNSDLSDGMICIFDFASSRVIRAIHISQKISRLHVIDSGCDIFTLPGPLRNFDGIIAVGTAGGDVHLVDICRQICEEALSIAGCAETRNELNPCQLNTITARDVSKIESHKAFAVRNSHHLSIHLNIVHDKTTEHFTLKGPGGDNRIIVNKAEVTVSALYYCSQLGSLLIGYNFGALQLYNLMTLELVYTSPVCDEHIPISHFAIQEPADDPKAVCYVWAVFSADEPYSACLSLAVMYSFCYNTKEYHEGYGFLYQDFSSASVSYQTELGELESSKKRIVRGSCLNARSIHQGPINKEQPQLDSNEDNLTLCVFVWNVCYSNNEIETFLGVFDLNQWYKEQMPSVPNPESNSYMIQLRLNDLIASSTKKNVQVLDVLADINSFQQFRGPQRLEAYFHPSSLSFRVTCLCDSDVIFMRTCGIQKALLARIESLGPLCLIEPVEIFQEIVDSELIPLFVDLPPNTPVSTNRQREIILGTALENRLLGWLCKCSSEWANGSFTSAGCSLEFLMSWAYERAMILKTQCDRFCVPLFDYSGMRLDDNTNALWNSATRQLNNLCSLHKYVLGKFSMFLSNLNFSTNSYKIIQSVAVYYDVLQWVLNVGLLPECPISTYPRSDDLGRINAPYLAEILSEYYNHARAVFKSLNEKHFGSTESVLFIDLFIEKEFGHTFLQDVWRRDGGNGLYPPPSLQALLQTYLMDEVPLSHKHLVLIYVFLDLAMALEPTIYKSVITYLIKFPAVFKVSSSVIKIIQAFWQLDHGDSNTAMGLLLDPMVSRQDLKLWHHRMVLKSLILQDQHNLALLYFQVRAPSFNEDEDLFTVTSLYVANNMLDEAFYLEKRFPDIERRKKFLVHYFKECEKHDNLDQLIHRSFSPTDEKIFLDYLVKSKTSEAQDLHVHYHLMRSRFLEAFESHESTTSDNIDARGLQGKEMAHMREKFVHSFKNSLPDFTRSVISFCRSAKHNTLQQDAKPTPLSVFVLNSTENVKYKSSMIGAALSKARETFDGTVDRFLLDTEGTPLLCTPSVGIRSKSSSAVVVHPKFVESERELDDSGSPPSCKRIKLSPRRVLNSSSSILKLETPLVKRKSPVTRKNVEPRGATPQSILKVKRLQNVTHSKSDFQDDITEFQQVEYTPVSSDKKSGLGISPQRLFTKPAVRFEGISSDSSSLNTTSPDKSKESPAVVGSSTDTSLEDKFYSPNTSLEEKQEAEVKIDKATTSGIYQSVTLHQKTDTGEVNRASPETWWKTPTRRKGLKRSAESAAESTPILIQSNEEPKFEEPAQVEQETVQNLDSSSIIPKLRPRKSLCRKVLESNTISRVLNSPLDSSSRNYPQSEKTPTAVETTKLTTTEETAEKVVLESSFNYSDGEETHKSILITKHNFTYSESDLNASEDLSIDSNSRMSSLLSESMVQYLKNCNKTVVGCNTTQQTLEDKETSVSFSSTENKGGDTHFEYVSDVKNDENEEAHEEHRFTITDLGEIHTVGSYSEIETSTIDQVEEMEVDCFNEKQECSEEEQNQNEIVASQTLLNVHGQGEEDVTKETVDYELHKNEVVNSDDSLDGTNNSYKQWGVMPEGTSTPSNVFEKNIISIDESQLPEEESNDQDDNEVVNKNDSEVIEIGSSSEESSKSEYSDNSSDSDVSRVERLDVKYEHNIYHTIMTHASRAGSSCSEHYSEESRCDENNATNDGWGLFEGEILLTVEEKKLQDRRSTMHDNENQHITIESSGDLEDETQAQAVENVLEISSDAQREDDVQVATQNIETEAPKDENLVPEEALENVTVSENIEHDRETRQHIIIESAGAKNVNETAAEDAQNRSGSDQTNPDEKKRDIAADEETEKIDNSDKADKSMADENILVFEDNENSLDQMDELIYSVYDETSDSKNVDEQTICKSVEYAEGSDEISNDKKEGGEEPHQDEDPLSITQSRKTQLLEMPARKQLSRDDDAPDNLKSLQTPKRERDIADRVLTEQPIRKLRSRTVSTEEEITKPTAKLRKRSASVDEASHDLPKTTIARETSYEKKKKAPTRTRRTLKKIIEIDDGVEVGKQTSDNISDTRKESEEEPNQEEGPLTTAVSHKPQLPDIPIQKRLTRGTGDVLDELESVETPKRERDIAECILTAQPNRKLRTRTLSTEEEVTRPTPKLRKRSASANEASNELQKPAIAMDTNDEKKKKATSRTRQTLTKISEDNDESVSESVVDNVLASRRATRRQVKLLEKANVSLMGDESIDEKSTEAGNSRVFKTDTKPVRRGRSASQTSNSSLISDSGSVGAPKNRRGRKASSDETKSVQVEQTEPAARVTRSRTQSVSSINSDDSDVKASRRKQKTPSTGPLPQIREESAKSTVPKKRTRKNSSQK